MKKKITCILKNYVASLSFFENARATCEFR